MKLLIRRLYLAIWQHLYAHYNTRFGSYVYVAIGDSTVEGIGATHPRRTYTHIIYSLIKQTQKGAIYHNFGKSSARIQDVLNQQLEKILVAKPDLITISIGANDVTHRTGLQKFEARLRELIETIQKETNAQIVMNNIPNFSLMPVVPRHLRLIANFQIKRYNRIIDRLTKEYDIIHIDMYAQSSLYAKHFPEAISKDNFHPSDFGYALWANTIITSIQHMLLTHPKAELR